MTHLNLHTESFLSPAFPMFGSTAPQVAMLPLVFIITVTAVKDGIEDYRRASLDDQVNNSAVTKLGDWRNVNQPRDPRNFLQRLLRIGPVPGKITRGVRKLREKDGAEGNRVALTRESGLGGASMSSVDLTPRHTRDQSLDDIRSVGSTDIERLGPTGHSYPPTRSFPSLSAIFPDDNGNIPAAGSQYALSTRTRYSGGVMDWDRQVTGTAHWERTLWKKLEVGDIVLLREDEQVPADIIVLSTSDATGLCYVETKNLDGETNLKPRRALKATSSIMSEEDLEHALFILDSEPPHANLYSFNGVIKYLSKPSIINPTSLSATEKLEPVTINEILLRGCAVRNTPWIIGLVAFTGADTKIMLNGGATPSKRSKIEKETNFNVIMNFVILLAMCLTAGIANAFYYSTDNSSGDFFEGGAAPSTIAVVNGIVTFG
jgi:phospholipid-translocating ATPase